ncbi:MAG: NUDIX domain-containing protein, partial [Mycobacteriales bacterium]
VQRPDDRILLARRSGVVYGDGLWGLPGGHADSSESWARAAVRETHEEVGVHVDLADLVPIGVQRYLDEGTHGVDAFFRTRRWSGEPQPVSECSQVAWFEPGDLPLDALPWLARTLRSHLLQGEWFTEMGMDAQ